MKKRKLLLLLMTLLPICSFSQATLTITPEQLKTTNLIFLEHKKLFEEVPLLNSKIETLEKINTSWLHTDSIRKANELQYQNRIKNDSIQLAKSQNSNKKTTVITIGSVILNIILGCLLLKQNIKIERGQYINTLKEVVTDV